MYFLWQLEKFNLPKSMMTHFLVYPPHLHHPSAVYHQWPAATIILQNNWLVFVSYLCMDYVFPAWRFLLCLFSFCVNCIPPPWGSGTNCDTIRFWPVPNKINLTPLCSRLGCGGTSILYIFGLIIIIIVQLQDLQTSLFPYDGSCVLNELVFNGRLFLLETSKISEW